jgi:hypothetical protein
MLSAYRKHGSHRMQIHYIYQGLPVMSKEGHMAHVGVLQYLSERDCKLYDMKAMSMHRALA